MKKISFNQPFAIGHEATYLSEVLSGNHWSGNGRFTQRCQAWLSDRLGGAKVLLTHSCTGALEMAALLLDIHPGDEVIIPSYTFVSTANAFVLRGATPVWADATPVSPHMDPQGIEALITSKTKAIVVVHYAGAPCDMEAIVAIANQYNLPIVEDAAQAILSSLHGRPLGTWGALATFSFHETKNIQSGEGGALVINDAQLVDRAERIWEKGTNRSAFFRGEVSKYQWVDVGSSFLPSELTAAVLYAQLEQLEQIHQKRKEIWEAYYAKLMPLADKQLIRLPPGDVSHNAHLFYLLLSSREARDSLIQHLQNRGVQAIFHYLPLHTSPVGQRVGRGEHLPNATMYGNCLVRLPLHLGLHREDIAYVAQQVYSFFDASGQAATSMQ